MRSSSLAPAIVSGVDALRAPSGAAVSEPVSLLNRNVLWCSGSVFTNWRGWKNFSFLKLLVDDRTLVDTTSLHVTDVSINNEYVLSEGILTKVDLGEIRRKAEEQSQRLHHALAMTE